METKKILKEAAAYLEYCGVVFSDREAVDILMDVLGITSRAQVLSVRLNADTLHVYWTRIQKRAERFPTAYIHGSVRFLELDLEVDSRVLIPRMETELLAEKIIQYLTQHPHIQTFYDVCCGSGCLGLSIKKYCPNVQVILSDICPKAVAVAKINASKNHLQVDVLEGDLFAPFSCPADAFVCNPPYLSFDEIMQTDPEVRCHEPWKALVGGSSGLEFYERIARDLDTILCPGGVGWLEIGYSQGERIKRIFANHGVHGSIHQDLSACDRIFFLENHASDTVSS
ncbi:Release factor glutamine methyltransferase [Chlamydia abortus]|uniref:peptide chain release factor N(5)-glutamine methyltransferase n=1 Tax=Chlamydia abortus TaxID=83555 RepID=UPI00192C2396|nr:peptide chain release factor N(5)-glutamine methyltransferase [Chlamydia abortus]CAD7584103.1 Peptide chain release factor N(5)-glutamine methyltransferase (EC 2.1.1.297) [Chlamydia abortus]CAG9045852.1 Release factor glutamine methyltransferase [Chlamydia abortus]